MEQNSNTDIENIFNLIQNEIADRDINPVDNSYTNYLLNEGTNKICKKIGEEATETVIAALSEGKEELIGEISDLIYHTLVLMYNKQVTLKEVKLKLEERFEIKGNKKKFNKRGNYQRFWEALPKSKRRN